MLSAEDPRERQPTAISPVLTVFPGAVAVNFPKGQHISHVAVKFVSASESKTKEMSLRTLRPCSFELAKQARPNSFTGTLGETKGWVDVAQCWARTAHQANIWSSYM